MKILVCVALFAMVFLGLVACTSIYSIYDEANYPEMRFEPGNQ
jgi:hypothetical protein